MAKRVYHRAKFDSSLSGPQREQFVDTKFSDLDGDGLEGVIFGLGGDVIFIVEGDSSKVDSAISDIQNASELESHQSIHDETISSTQGKLYSHVDRDARETS